MAELPTRSDGRTIDMAWFNDVKKVIQGIGSIANDTLQFPVIGTSIPSRVAGKLFRDSNNKLKIATSTRNTGDKFVSETAEAATTDGRIFKASGTNLVAEVQDQTSGWLAASAAVTPSGTSTNGAALIFEEAVARAFWYELRFNASSSEYAQWQFVIPPNADLDNVEISIVWKAAATSGAVRWSISYISVGNGDTWNLNPTSFGSVGQSTVGSAAERVNQFTRTANITGSVEDIIRIQIARIGGNSLDTMSGDAKVLGVRVKMGLSH